MKDPWKSQRWVGLKVGGGAGEGGQGKVETTALEQQ